jgi:hypothetical protein
MLILVAGTVSAQVGTGTFRVDGVSGIDSAGCGGEQTPCKSIQQAVNLASTGETILVAAGTYTYDASLNLNCLNFTAVVCVKSKEVSIFGGFGGGDWQNPDPVNNLTVIDGEDTNQGVHVRDVGTTTSLRLEGFTVTHGRDQGATSGSATDTAGRGGGLASYNARVELRDLIFSGNYAIGGNTNLSAGGGGQGGGVYLHTAAGVSVLERITFNDNHALGGSGVEKGGWGMGGGLWTYKSEVSLTDVVVTNNVATAGSTNGSGIYQGQKSDAQGGGVAFHVDTTATVNGLTATGNTANGGHAPNGSAGGAFGGGVYTELAINVVLNDIDVRDNISQGGDGVTGGLGGGGGIFNHVTSMTIERARIIANQALGGVGTTKQGNAGGGGVWFNTPTTYSIGAAAVVTNAIVADNLAQLGTGSGGSGGGGGFYFYRVNGVLSHCTFARNQLGSETMQGLAMSLLDIDPIQVDIDYTIIADHSGVVPATPALKVQAGSTANLNRVLFANNDLDTNDGLYGAGTINGLASSVYATSAGFFSPGAPDYDYHIVYSSAARDEATGSTESVDFEGQLRDDGYPDIGADEEGPTAIFADGFESGDLSAWSVSVT